LYNKNAAKEIASRKKPGDMIMCFHGWENQGAANANSDLLIVEPYIAYDHTAVFAPYRAFVSYSQMHYYYGLHRMILSPSWYDAVIPNAFTPSEFEFNDKKDDYFVYLGRVNFDKGIDLCVQVTKHIGKRLIIAGPTKDLKHLGYSEMPSHVECVGYVGPKERSDLLSKAQCLMAPSHYIEPFGNIVAEAQFCGTPVLTTDWGGYVDSVVHGVTGYRCKDFKSFVDCANIITQLSPSVCRTWAMQNFSDTVVHDKFDEWLQKIIRKNFYYV
jgi:glycosyltransferase involved in cell wall biosynthesis